ncbi:MAG: hypothetical protein M3P97_11795, partial [Actinomycetota bacterium]|nr:hypothetical protein [Actinomycetota bacterium]
METVHRERRRAGVKGAARVLLSCAVTLGALLVFAGTVFAGAASAESAGQPVHLTADGEAQPPAAPHDTSPASAAARGPAHVGGNDAATPPVRPGSALLGERPEPAGVDRPGPTATATAPGAGAKQSSAPATEEVEAEARPELPVLAKHVDDAEARPLVDARSRE